MRLSTIWTIPRMSTIERLRRTQVWAVTAFASKLPQTIKYAVLIEELEKLNKKSNGSTMKKVLNDKFNN